MNVTTLKIVCVCFSLSLIVNFSCGSETNCQCKDIVLRKTECARAYLDEECNFHYLDFRGNKEFFDNITKNQFKNKISSIVVRPGCRLEIFEEEDFDGDSEVLTGINEDLRNSTIFNSYNCTCEEGIEQSPIPRKIRLKSYPPMINIPNTHEEILALLNGTHRHSGLLRALESSKNKRSPKNAYILVLGLTGAGKSSTINALFDNPNITSVGGYSGTGIDEYRIPVLLDELGISNSELRIIDTPGFMDARGLEQDMKFLVTLDNYLNGHEELNKYIPNVVLIFNKFNDNRLKGYGSNFVKMLRGIQSVRDRIVDNKFSNVIFVQTHYMSESKYLTRRPTRKLAEIRKTIEDFSLFPKPVKIVVAENRALENGLLMLNGYFKLPNGEFYPKNLYDEIQLATSSGWDPIGEAIFRTAFKNADDFNITAIHTPLISNTSVYAFKYWDALGVTGCYMTIPTEITNTLDSAYESLSVDLKRRFSHDSLFYLKKTLISRNIDSKTDLPQNTVDITKFLKEILRNEADMFLMEKAFGLKVPDLDENLNLVVGYGYNIIQDTVLRSTPFNFSSKTISDIGYTIPSMLTCKLESSIHNFYKVYSNMTADSDVRQQDLNVQLSAQIKILKQKTKPDSSAPDRNILKAIREYRVFELTLNKNSNFTEEFLASVKGLQIYNKTENEGVDIWIKFFAQFGTHVVKSVHGGGSIEIQLNCTNPTNFVSLVNILEFIEDLRIGQLNRGSLDTNGTEYALKFNGGDSKYHVTNFGNMSINDASQVLQNWTESLTYYPVILQSHLELLPITEVVNKISRNISHQIEHAALDIFNISLKYIQPPQTKLPPARENIKMLGQSPQEELNCELAYF